MDLMLEQGLLFEERITDYFSYKFPLPQYLGAKYKHLSWIGHYIPSGISIVADGFAGSQSVAFFFKQLGYKVYTNDFMNYSNQIGKALIENNNTTLENDDIDVLFSANENPEKFCLMEKLYSDLFFIREEAQFLDSFRYNVDKLPSIKKSLALAIMNRALTRKITMGHFAHTQALNYSNNPARIKRNTSLARPIKDLFLELLPEYNQAVFDNGYDNFSYQDDVLNFVENLNNVDLIYFDPPYCNSHPDYQSFYHLLETYVEYWSDKTFINKTKRYSPKIYSGFDTKKDIIVSFNRLFKIASKIPYWIISYNDRSYPSQEQMVDMISQYKNVKVEYKPYTNSVGGKGSVKDSKELLFICCPKY